jgi:hypothetical protein
VVLVPPSVPNLHQHGQRSDSGVEVGIRAVRHLEPGGAAAGFVPARQADPGGAASEPGARPVRIRAHVGRRGRPPGCRAWPWAVGRHAWTRLHFLPTSHGPFLSCSGTGQAHRISSSSIQAASIHPLIIGLPWLIIYLSTLEFLCAFVVKKACRDIN